MKDLSPADQYLLDEIRRGSEAGWSQLVGRYQGRLLAFARSRLRQPSEAEDMVQEAFLSFLKTVGAFRGEASLETYLFLILRRKIADHYRGQKLPVCLLQELYPAESDADRHNDLDQVQSRELTASRYARQDEDRAMRKSALAAALRDVFDDLKGRPAFRDLKVLELIFLCRMKNKDIAHVLGLEESQVALVKHRTVRHLQAKTAGGKDLDLMEWPVSGDSILGEIWEEQRLSCVKRNTIGSYLLGTLEPEWQEYVGFHLDRVGCRFCRANLADLTEQAAQDHGGALRDRILESTAGFFRKSR